MTGGERFPWGAVSLLGVLTIVGYGTWHYSFGVLLEPILDDTDWSEEWLVAAFSATGLIGAFAAPLAGRMIDRQRFRLALAATGVVSAAGLMLASTTDSLVVFVVSTGVAGSMLAAFALYHVTQTLAVRYAPTKSARSVSVLTWWGAFASTIYLPFTAYLVDAADWRFAVRVLAVIAGVYLVGAALMLPAPPRTETFEQTRGLAYLTEPAVRRYAIASFGCGLAVGIVLVYQVTIMTLAGLSLTAAAWLAGARGIAQFVGRLPVIWMAERYGSRRSLQTAYAAIAVGCGVLAFAVNPIIGLAYVIVGGFGIGATSPLVGIHSSTIFPPDRLGQGMGSMSLVFGLAMALGPTTVALVADGETVRWLGPTVAAAGAALAVVMMTEPRSVSAGRERSVHPSAEA
ncbi:MAG: MFS transporter [Actinomycetota bacterium]